MADDISIAFSADIGEVISGVDQVKDQLTSIAAPVNALASEFASFGSAFLKQMDAYKDGLEELTEQIDQQNTSIADLKAANDSASGGYRELADGAREAGGGFASTAENILNTINHLKLVALAAYALSPAFRSIVNPGITGGLSVMRSQLGAIAPTLESIGRRSLPLVVNGLSFFSRVAGPIGIAVAAFELLNATWGKGAELLDQYSDAERKLFGGDVDSELKSLTKFQDVVDPSVVARATALATELAAAKKNISDFLTVQFDLTEPALKLEGAWVKIVSLIGDAAKKANDITPPDMSWIAQALKLYSMSDVLSGGRLGNYGGGEISPTGDVLGKADKIYGAADALRQATAKLAAGLAGGGDNFVGRFTQDINALSGKGAPAQAQPGDNSAQLEQYRTMVKAADDGYAQLKQLYTADAEALRISTDQETQGLLAALNFRHEAEDAVYAAALQAAQNDAVKYEEIQKQKVTADDKWKLEHNQIVAEALKKDTAEWQSLLSPVESAWNSQLRSLLAGTETWSQAMKKILGDLVISAIEGFEKIAVEKAASGLANMFGGPTSFLGGLLGGGGQSASTTANTTALGTLTTAISALNVTLGGHAIATTANTAGTVANTGVTGASTVATTAQAVSTDGSIAATLAQTISTDAQTVATWALEAITAVKAVFGFAQGAWSIPHDMVAQVHEGEMIVPKEGGHADAMRTALSSGLAGLTQRVFKFDMGTDYVLSPGLAMIHQGEAVMPAAARGSGPYTGGGAGMQPDQSRHIGRLISSHETAMRDLVSSHKRSMSSLESEISQLHRKLR